MVRATIRRGIFVGGHWQEGMSGKCVVSKQLDMSGWLRSPECIGGVRGGSGWVAGESVQGRPARRVRR